MCVCSNFLKNFSDEIYGGLKNLPKLYNVSGLRFIMFTFSSQVNEALNPKDFTTFSVFLSKAPKGYTIAVGVKLVFSDIKFCAFSRSLESLDL